MRLKYCSANVGQQKWALSTTSSTPCRVPITVLHSLESTVQSKNLKLVPIFKKNTYLCGFGSKKSLIVVNCYDKMLLFQIMTTTMPSQLTVSGAVLVGVNNTTGYNIWQWGRASPTQIRLDKVYTKVSKLRVAACRLARTRITTM